MEKSKKMSPYKKKVLRLVLGSLANTLALVFAMFASGYALTGQTHLVAPFSCVAFVAIGAFNFGKFLVSTSKGIFRNKYLIFSLIYLGLGAAVFFAPLFELIYLIVTAIFLSMIIINRILIIIKNHKLASIIFNVLIAGFALFLLVTLFIPSNSGQSEIIDSPSLIFGLSLLLIVGLSFITIMGISFANFRKNALLKIIKKTYAAEILYGLATLLVAIAILLSMIEPGMQKIGDALWYCFAIVTTIGFGDIVATTVIGRILSVILGIYGIVVVALITSIIVNLYNENANKRNNKKEENENDPFADD